MGSWSCRCGLLVTFPWKAGGFFLLIPLPACRAMQSLVPPPCGDLLITPELRLPGLPWPCETEAVAMARGGWGIGMPISFHGQAAAPAPSQAAGPCLGHAHMPPPGGCPPGPERAWSPRPPSLSQAAQPACPPLTAHLDGSASVGPSSTPCCFSICLITKQKLQSGLLYFCMWNNSQSPLPSGVTSGWPLVISP